MRRLSQPLFIIAVLLAQPGMAAECSRADINHYLDQGYSLAKITQLCAEESPASAPTSSHVDDSIDPATLVYLQTAIDAEDVVVSADNLTLRQERCFPYGEEGFSGIRPSACVTREITIPRKGLTIGDVVEARFLIRDGKLIVRGDIRQSFSNTEKLRQRELKGLLAEYPAKLREYDVPVKSSMKRKKVAAALEKLAK